MTATTSARNVSHVERGLNWASSTLPCNPQLGDERYEMHTTLSWFQIEEVVPPIYANLSILTFILLRPLTWQPHLHAWLTELEADAISEKNGEITYTHTPAQE